MGSRVLEVRPLKPNNKDYFHSGLYQLSSDLDLNLASFPAKKLTILRQLVDRQEPKLLTKCNTMYTLSIMTKVITIKTDDETKKQAQAVAKDMGLTMSALINSYLKQIIATRRVEIYAPEQMTPKLEKLVGKIEKDIKAGNVSPPYDTAEDFLKALHRAPDED